MKLKSLLAAGQSFANLEEKTRYAMCRENPFPAFSTQPRLRRNGHPARTPTQLELGDLPGPRKESSAPAAQRAQEKQLELSEQAHSTPAPAKKPGFWSFFKNLFGLRRRRGSRQFVQSEMDLERVKVARNDLSDADLELVVPGKNGRPARPLYKTQHSAERNPLIRVRTRLFETAQR